MNLVERDIMNGLVSVLNEASIAYYSGNPIMSDEDFDARLSDLKQLEEETGFVYSNSPTINVGVKILTELKEVEHSVPMLSLDKCHNVDDIAKFSNGKELIASIKLDGMSCRLTYENGILVRGESRGNGHIGNDITEHVKRFKNVPLKINKTSTYIIDGEAVIDDNDFSELNKYNEFKNSRNLTAGSLSVLDTSLVAKRKIQFIAWDVVDGYDSNSLKDNLTEAELLGFDIVSFWAINNFGHDKLQSCVDFVYDFAHDDGMPCDGVVFKFNDIEYGKSLGATSHHFRNGIAYKAKDDGYETELISIDWTLGKTGQITPTAVFKSVEIYNTIVERASLHNISVMTELLGEEPHIGQSITVTKCNMIIPQVVKADKSYCGIQDLILDIPTTCPVCGGKTEIKQDNDSKVLVCTNDNCKGKLLGKLAHFVSKNAMNIDGLSEATLEKFIEFGWISSFEDIYNLKHYFSEMIRMDGFGEKSVKNLIDAIHASKNTTLDRFVYALCIPLIGRSASKTISKYFNGDFERFYKECCMNQFNFNVLDDFGDSMNESINNYIEKNVVMIGELSKYMAFEKKESVSVSNSLAGKTFCITGALGYFANRDEVKEKIESLGGKVVNSVSYKLDFLVCNEESSSSKYKKAKELDIEIINEEELIKMLT